MAIPQLLGKYTLAVMLLIATSTAVAQTPPAIVAQGRGAALACVTCHGVDGAGNAQAGYPALAQLPQAYLAKQIADFKTGTRTHPLMTPIAKAMSAKDADSAARFYSGLAFPTIPSAPLAATLDPALKARGEHLVTNGAWERNIPACFKCHVDGGLGVEPAFPRLAGQHATYTVNQLQAWKSGTRSNDPLKLMKSIADHLTADEITAVANYLATLGMQEAKK